jgi:hypothetical protein
VGRVPRLTAPYVESLDDLRIVPGSTRARAVATAVRDIAKAPELPLPNDVEGPLPRKAALRIAQLEGRPLLTAYARRVAGHRLWVWYRPEPAGLVDFVALTSVPPG